MKLIKTITISAAVLLSSTAMAERFDPSIARQAWVEIAKIEKDNAIPRGLLHSMSLVETGQGLDGNILPWPYTIGVNPTKKHKFESMDPALSKLDKLRRIGFKRFNVILDGKKSRNLSVKTVEELLLGTKFGEVKLQGRHFSKRFSNKGKAGVFARNIIRKGYDNLDLGLMQINWHWHKKGFASVEDALDPTKNTNYAVSYLKKHKEKKDWWGSVGRYHSGTENHAKRYIRVVYSMYRKVHKLAKA